MIYIIDDDQNVREGFIILLQSAGFKCRSFERADEFLKIPEHDDNDIIIMDLQMPNQSGCNLLETLQNNKIFLPVIIITAQDDKISRECAKKYGAIAYLRKPVDGTALIDLIKYKLDSIISSKIKLST